MRWNLFQKLLGLLIGIAYAAVIVVHIGPNSRTAAEGVVRSLEMCLPVLVAVALIWFPEQIGSATGFIGHGSVNSETPPAVVTLFGWLILLGLPVLAYIAH